jgi:ABC-type multidrug transport system fused ATPase/permease subunit
MPGSFIAITGPSGSGKSTLVDLILGFLKPTSGLVLIDDLDPIKARKIWPGKISYVPQDVQIFEGSLAANVVLNSEGEYDKAILQESLKLSGLIRDIGNLDDGVDTLVGERGLKLSGGQKQRLGIARALYSNPKLIVFDEATSSLDPITENQIAENVYRNLSDRTVIVIAHRLSTVMRADTVLYFKEGRLVASGTFEDLKQSVPEFLEQAELSGL